MGGIISKSVTTNDFIFYQKLGKGEFGEVILIKNRNNFQYFAVKEINLMKVFENGVKPIMLSNELNALKRLQSHSFITELVCSFIEGNYCYIVLEYLNGGTLRDLLFMKYTFTERQVAFFVGCITSGLAYIHRHGIIHRDIKPENIVLDWKGLPHIADFGISYVEPSYPASVDGNSNSNSTPAPILCRMTSGTEQYCAPECLAVPHEHGIEVDYWSLGIMMYELMFQMRPYKSRVPKNCVRYVEGLRKPTDSSEEIFGSGFQPKSSSQAKAQVPSSFPFKKFNLHNLWQGHSPTERKIKPAAGSHSKEISHRSVTWKFESEHSLSFSLAAILNRSNRVAVAAGSVRAANPSQRVVVESRESRLSNPPLSVSSSTHSANQATHSTHLHNQVSFSQPAEELVCPSCSDTLPLSLAVPLPPPQYYVHAKREKPSPAFFSLLGMLLDVRANHRIGHEATVCRPAILDHSWFAEQDLPISTLKTMCFEDSTTPFNLNEFPGIPLNSSTLPTHLIHDNRPPKSLLHQLLPNQKLYKLRKEIGDFTFVSSRYSCRANSNSSP